jgi:hypothetical protein
VRLESHPVHPTVDLLKRIYKPTGTRHDPIGMADKLRLMAADFYSWSVAIEKNWTESSVSYEQCMASSRWCDRNPMYQPPAGQPTRSRRR